MYIIYHIIILKQAALKGGFFMELKDKFESGRDVPWKEKKEKSIELEGIYKELYKYKSEQDPGKDRFKKRYIRIHDCGTWLKFRTDSNYNKKKLIEANFCRIRLCPMCMWRRSLKIYSSMLKISKALEEKQYNYFLLTLTVRNVIDKELRTAIKNLEESFSRFRKLRDVKRIVKGYFKAIEITVNQNVYSEWFGTYHPHIHCIIAIDDPAPEWIFDNKYIRKLWKNCTRSSYYPECDIRMIKQDKLKSMEYCISEISKYTVKDKDILIENMLLRIRNIETLDYSLEGLRLVSLGGVMKEVSRLLNLDDCIDGDLINLELEDGKEDILDNCITFVWNYGLMGYYSI